LSAQAQRGLSLMELVITLALLGLLAALAAPLAETAVQRKKERELRSGLQHIRQAIDAYKRAADAGYIVVESGKSGFPPSLDALTTAIQVKSDPKAGPAAAASGVTGITLSGVSGLPGAGNAAAAPAASAAADGSIIFLRRVPRDPFADPALPAAATWGLRAYASPPDQPAPGEDVFDVYSRAEGKGLNGIPYRDW
jgi:general secretion pathway protein G